MADMDVDGLEHNEDEFAEEKIINEEYKIWKKNAPFLYDVLMSTALDWPTLTAQWLPDKQAIPDKPAATHRLLIGTHTANDQPNYIQIAHVQLPNRAEVDTDEYDEEREEAGGYGGAGRKRSGQEVKFNIVQRIDHEGEVNKARYMPQNANIIATMCTDGRVMVFDRTKHPLQPSGVVNPQLELVGHAREGFGLAWHPEKEMEGWLATGSEDNTVRVWDINAHGANPSNKLISAVSTFKHHSSIVNDVQWHPMHRKLLGSVSDDKTMQLWDTRDGNKPVRVFADGHSDAINALSFNPGTEYVVATGSADKSIGLWDLRNYRHKIHVLQGHHDSITALEWNPFEESVLGSASYDRRVCCWDLTLIGAEQTPEDAEDGPPELLFMHGGHTNRISDFSWNKNDPWMLCSAAEDNVIQVWQPDERIVGKHADEDSDEKLDSLQL